jgi:gas vesicle protein
MTDSPEEIRARIEATRTELGGDVDALADKVTPSKIVGRQTDKVKGAVGSVKDRVFGVADDVKSSVSDHGGNASGAVSDAASTAKAKAEGNPLAVGLIAFGVGLLAASLIPASTKEKEVASNIKEQAQPLVDQVTDAAKEVGQNLKEPAQDAAAAVKDAATGAVDNVKSEASSAAGEVKDQAQQSKDTVQNS